MTADCIVVGAGPSGSVAAALLARAGMDVVLLDRSSFPREKVCGDCLNPAAWRILDRLGLREAAFSLPHRILTSLSVQGLSGRGIDVSLVRPGDPEIAVRRRDFDAMLLAGAIKEGAEFRQGVEITNWKPGNILDTSIGPIHGRVILAADGRNSRIARAAGLICPPARERVGMQCHFPISSPGPDRVTMLFHRWGYGGVAPISDTAANLCLVASMGHSEHLRRHAEERFSLPPDSVWKSIAPLKRADAASVAANGLFLLGDAARVVEPFTGEGIYYAMRSGELAADALIGHPLAEAEKLYRNSHPGIYRGRLWVNQLSRLAGTRPGVTSAILNTLRHYPRPIQALVRRVV